MIKIGVVTLFPEMFSALDSGVTGRAIHQGLLECLFFNPRNWAKDRHKTVDDRPYGGGPGMVMKAEPLLAAIREARGKLGEPAAKLVYLSPQGERFSQNKAIKWASESALIFVAGRYEGIDERVMLQEPGDECSLGDYVLSGGELAAMVMIDSLARWVPGVLGHDESALQDSFTQGLLDCPHYTRPELSDGWVVPEVLLSGDHEAIRRWRSKQALGRTWLRRPDLLEGRMLTSEEQYLLDEFINEMKGKNDE